MKITSEGVSSFIQFYSSHLRLFLFSTLSKSLKGTAVIDNHTHLRANPSGMWAIGFIINCAVKGSGPAEGFSGVVWTL